MIIAVCNMCGSLTGGWLVDRISMIRLLGGLPLLSAGALLLLLMPHKAGLLLLGLGMTGITYGSIIAVYPATIAKMFGIDDSTRIYGWVFTSWGGAGLIAPWLAGLLFDHSGNYTTAIQTAATLSLLSAGAASVLFSLRVEDKPL